MKTNANFGRSWTQKGSRGKVIRPGELRKNCKTRGKVTNTASTSTGSNLGGSMRRITSAGTTANARMNDVPINDTTNQDQDLVGTLQSPATQERTPIIREHTTDYQKKRKRGPNKCKKVAKLKPGEKLNLLFNIRAVGENHEEFSRFLGKIVRNPSICPLAVPRWMNIPQETIDHMWAIVQEKWHVDDEYKKVVIDWMRGLWRNARADFKRFYVKPCRNVEEAVKNIPPEVVKEEWECLVRVHFASAKFKEQSEQNAKNRANVSMPCRTGSKPSREISHQIEKKTGAPPDYATLYFETCQKEGRLVDLASIEKHNHIIEIQNTQPDLTPFEVVEESMGRQKSDRVFGYGGGVTPKHFKGSAATKKNTSTQLKLVLEENAALKVGLTANSTQLKLVLEENVALKEGMKHMNSELSEVKEMLRCLVRERASSPNRSPQNN